MRFLKSILKDKTLNETMKEISKRFPVSIIIMLVGAGILFYLLHFIDYNDDSPIVMRLLFSLIMSFFTSIGVYLIFENHTISKKLHLLSHLLPFAFIVLFYSGLSPRIESFESIVFFLLGLTGIISALFVSPYILKINCNDYKETKYYTYFYRMSTIFLISFILGGALTFLGNIAIAAVFMLFDLDGIISNKLIGDWMIIALALITPMFALSQIPNKKEITSTKFVQNSFFSFLIKFIAIPFIFCYFLILYTYSGKVLLSFGDWPKGEVSWMVIGFSSFAYIIYIFSQVFVKKNPIIAKIRQALPYVVFPQLFMLFYAIYLRIHQYDITVNRYFVVVFGIWLLIISLYYIISARKKLVIIPASLTLMSILISIGPWSVYNLPESRQLERLKNNLIEANILQNDEIIPLASENDISQVLSKEIYGGIDYLCDFDNCNSIKKLFPKIYSDYVKQHQEDFETQKAEQAKTLSTENEYARILGERGYREPHPWEIVTEITSQLKVKNYFEITKDQEYIFISLDYSKSFFPIDTSNYSKIYEFRGVNSQENHAHLNTQEASIELPDGTKYDISTIIEQFTTLYNSPGLQNPIKDPDLLMFEVDGARIFIKNINIKNPDYTGEKSGYSYYGGEGYILIP